MGDAESIVRGLNRNQELRLVDPDIGDVAVLIPEPRETSTVAPGTKQFVFTHASGRVIGLNWETPSDGDDSWDECTLVADSDGWHHALLLQDDGQVHLLTRQEPGQPDDWEPRGVVTEIVELDSEPA